MAKVVCKSLTVAMGGRLKKKYAKKVLFYPLRERVASKKREKMDHKGGPHLGVRESNGPHRTSYGVGESLAK